MFLLLRKKLVGEFHHQKDSQNDGRTFSICQFLSEQSIWPQNCIFHDYFQKSLHNHMHRKWFKCLRFLLSYSNFCLSSQVNKPLQHSPENSTEIELERPMPRKYHCFTLMTKENHSLTKQMPSSSRS